MRGLKWKSYIKPESKETVQDLFTTTRISGPQQTSEYQNVDKGHAVWQSDAVGTSFSPDDDDLDSRKRFPLVF